MIRVLTWNLFHGRDFPPDPALRTVRSRLFRLTERNDTHAQVNRDLREEFTAVIAKLEWDVALFQECPPHWAPHLTAHFNCDSFSIPTSRNALAPVRRAIAALNPDLIGANEGGSNLVLSRVGPLTDHQVLAISPGPRPERRTVGFARVGEFCVANLHASVTQQALAEREIRLAAERCVQWAGDSPLILGGDFNVRPSRSDVFDDLATRFGLRGTAADNSIDHLLARGLEPTVPPVAMPPEAREVDGPDGLRLRLSDHAPVAAGFNAQAG